MGFSTLTEQQPHKDLGKCFKKVHEVLHDEVQRQSSSS